MGKIKVVSYKDLPEEAYGNTEYFEGDVLVELEACPFCGGRAFLNANGREWFGNCNGWIRFEGFSGSCGAVGTPHWDPFTAIKLWNSRTGDGILETKDIRRGAVGRGEPE